MANMISNILQKLIGKKNAAVPSGLSRGSVQVNFWEVASEKRELFLLPKPDTGPRFSRAV
jgi:hypothetical protein